MQGRILKILAIASVTICLICALSHAVFADESPAVSIDYCNLTFEDQTHIKYAVKFDGIADEDITRFNTGMLYWTKPQEKYTPESAEHESKIIGYTEIAGEKYYTFSYDKFAAKEMTDYVYSVAYVIVDGEYCYSEVAKYSILTYAYDKLGYTGTPSDSAAYRETLEALLIFGAEAQRNFNYKTDRPANARYYQVKVVGGTLSDGSDRGLYLEGERPVVTSRDGTRTTTVTVGRSNVEIDATTGQMIHHHDYSECIHTPATCTEIGYDTYLCKNGCFTTIVLKYNDKGEALYPVTAHDLYQQIILPICDPASPGTSGLDGFVIEKCTRCSYESMDTTLAFDFNDPTHHPGAYVFRVIQRADGENPEITEWACPTCSMIFVVEDHSTVNKQ